MAQSSNLIYFLKIATKFENLTSSINNQQASFIFKILTFRQLLSLVGYTAGTAIDKTTDVVTDTAKVGIDLAGGAVDDVAKLLIDASKQDGNPPSLDLKINQGAIKIAEPTPDKTENPIQNAPAAAKKSWCLVGEYQGRRGCIEVSDQDKCISGQVFPEQKMCLNPTLSQNVKP